MPVQQVRCIGVLLAEDRDQHVAAQDLVLARRLHMVQRALQNTLEADGRLRIALFLLQHGHVIGQHLSQVVFQAGHVTFAGAQDAERRGIFQQRQQHVLHGQVFVALVAGFLISLADGKF